MNRTFLPCSNNKLSQTFPRQHPLERISNFLHEMSRYDKLCWCTCTWVTRSKTFKVPLKSNSRYSFSYIFVCIDSFLKILSNFNLLRTHVFWTLLEFTAAINFPFPVYDIIFSKIPQGLKVLKTLKLRAIFYPNCDYNFNPCGINQILNEDSLRTTYVRKNSWHTRLHRRLS